mgnify:CR=1 FL=1
MSHKVFNNTLEGQRNKTNFDHEFDYNHFFCSGYTTVIIINIDPIKSSLVILCERAHNINYMTN